MSRILASSTAAAVASILLVGTAAAQVTVPPGQDFYATPIQKGPMIMMPEARIAMPAPAGKAMMKRKMMKKKMMKKRM